MVALLQMPQSIDADLHDERRIFPRKHIEAEVRGFRLDHTVEARQRPRLTLRLRDLSLGGLSATCDTPINSGERVSVFFPPLGKSGGWDACGRVLRCQPGALGYRIAVEFDPLPAA